MELDLKLLRSLSGLSQEEIARQLELDQSSVSLYESGQRLVPRTTADSIASLCVLRGVLNWKRLRSAVGARP